jgi:uncharacterized membrane protein YhdT
MFFFLIFLALAVSTFSAFPEWPAYAHVAVPLLVVVVLRLAITLLGRK